MDTFNLGAAAAVLFVTMGTVIGALLTELGNPAPTRREVFALVALCLLAGIAAGLLLPEM